MVEDNPQYREVIEIALSEEPHIDLVAQFGAIEVALHSLRDPAISENVDILLLDIRLPGMSGVAGKRGEVFVGVVARPAILRGTEKKSTETVGAVVGEKEKEGFVAIFRALDEIDAALGQDRLQRLDGS